MEEIKTYKITGKVASNNEPVSGAKIKVDTTEVYSGIDGSFIIEGQYSDVFNLVIYKENFSTHVELPFNSDDTIKNDIGIIELSPLQSALNQNISKLQTLPESSVKDIVASKTTFETLQQKKLNDVLITLQFTLLPVVLRMLSNFGVSNAKQALDKNFSQPLICPSLNQINQIISQKNKLVKQLNSTYKIISATTLISDTTLIFISSLETLQKATLATPTPTPPAVPASENTLDQQIKKYKTIVASISITLKVLGEVLKTIIEYLNLLDQYIQHCSPDSNISQEAISTELTNLTTQQSNQTSPIVTNVNGFEMGVETEKTTNSLKRRRAIARNKQGVVMLKGEWSFSSIDQILIDELVFYIQQNNLKAD